MKKTILTICCVVLIITSLSGCNSETLIADNELYDLKKIGKDFYMVLDDSIEPDRDPGLISGALSFDSVEEMIDTIKNGKLDKRQLQRIKRTSKQDSNGVIICNLLNIQVPVLPDEFEYREVNWNRTGYSFFVQASTGEEGWLSYIPKENYESSYERNYLNFFDNELITLENTVKNKNKTEYYYSTSVAELKRVTYTVKNGGTTLVVDEKYRLNIKDSNLSVSDTIPDRVTIYGRKSNHYFTISLSNLKEPPTAEWIKSFGIKDYE